MEHQAEQVGRAVEGRKIEQPGQIGGAHIGHYQIPMAVENQRRIGVVALQHHLQNAPRRRQIGILEAALAVMRCIAGGVQEHVALAERQFERFGQTQHHRPARLRAPRFDKADMARRNAGLERQRQLAHAMQPARLLNRPAKGCVCHRLLLSTPIANILAP